MGACLCGMISLTIESAHQVKLMANPDYDPQVHGLPPYGERPSSSLPATAMPARRFASCSPPNVHSL